MGTRERRYLQFHILLLLLFVLLAGYAYATVRLLPPTAIHCILHDLLHLYCPFCGCTRAFLALLGARPLLALRLNAAAVVAVVAFLVLDLRALLLLCRKKEGALLPFWVERASILFFWWFFLLRNLLMLWGIDPTGDLAPLWQGRLSTGVLLLVSLLLCLAGVALTLLLLRFWGRAHRAPAPFGQSENKGVER